MFDEITQFKIVQDFDLWITQYYTEISFIVWALIHIPTTHSKIVYDNCHDQTFRHHRFLAVIQGRNIDCNLFGFIFSATDGTVRGRHRATSLRGRPPVSRGRMLLLDTVSAASRRLSRVQLLADAVGRRRRRAAHHRSRAGRPTAQDVVPSGSAANAARAISHARQHQTWVTRTPPRRRQFASAGSEGTSLRGESLRYLVRVFVVRVKCMLVSDVSSSVKKKKPRTIPGNRSLDRPRFVIIFFGNCVTATRSCTTTILPAKNDFSVIGLVCTSLSMYAVVNFYRALAGPAPGSNACLTRAFRVSSTAGTINRFIKKLAVFFFFVIILIV